MTATAQNKKVSHIRDLLTIPGDRLENPGHVWAKRDVGDARVFFRRFALRRRRRTDSRKSWRAAGQRRARQETVHGTALPYVPRHRRAGWRTRRRAEDLPESFSLCGVCNTDPQAATSDAAVQRKIRQRPGPRRHVPLPLFHQTFAGGEGYSFTPGFLASTGDGAAAEALSAACDFFTSPPFHCVTSSPRHFVLRYCAQRVDVQRP
jgi:hypothetical protein